VAVDGFVFKGVASRVIFGSGTLARTGQELDRLGHARALVLSTPEQAGAAESLAASLGPRAAGVFSGARMHTPVSVTQSALERFANLGADCVVALGGGSTIGLGKAIAARTGADQIAIPTTYAGSEMTDILGETADGRKVTRRDAAILPETVIYDVDLTLGLPIGMSVSSALNAIAHAAEALYAPDRNPVISLLAADAVRAFHRALPVIVRAPQDNAARADALYGAWLCGMALGQTAMGLHHKLCHILGGSFDLPHAETHSILLPHCVGYNAAAVPGLLQPLADILGAPPGPGLWHFARDIGAPLRLADLGLAEDDLDRAAALAVANPYDNPRPLDQAAIRAMLQNAWQGTCPPA